MVDILVEPRGSRGRNSGGEVWLINGNGGILKSSKRQLTRGQTTEEQATQEIDTWGQPLDNAKDVLGQFTQGKELPLDVENYQTY